jgi:hypothetical protein
MKKISPNMETYKILQTILEKVRERAEAARFSKSHDDLLYAMLDNQERLSEAVLIIGAALQIIIDKQLVVTVSAPPEAERN